MRISSLYLEAFSEVAKAKSFSKAAKSLHITQSALSQRVAGLERDLETTLFIRDTRSVALTPVGERLLRYCQVSEELELDFLENLVSSSNKLAGVVRIASVSTALRSIVTPALGNLMMENPGINLELSSKEVREMSRLLLNGEVDFAVTNEEPKRGDVECLLLGYEENVLVGATDSRCNRRDVYIDHDVDDQTTHQFLEENGKSTSGLRRLYLDEIYTIMDGVEKGWGRAVVPRHLTRERSEIKIIRGFKPLRIPIYLHYHHQPFYSRLHARIRSDLLKYAKKILSC